MERVFVYGTLKRGFWNHHFLETSAFLGNAVTLERFALYVETIPFVVKGQSVSRISGEVYKVEEKQLALLDKLEGHPHWYRREQTPVLLDTQSGTERKIEAWVYFFPNSHGVLIESGIFGIY